MATDAATALARRDVGGRVVVQPMGRCRRTMRMVIEIIAGMAGGAGVRGGTGFADDSVASGNASQGDWGNDTAMAGRAGVVIFRTARIDQGHGEMTGLDAGGAAATDKGAVVRDMSCRPVGMAVYTGERGFVGRSPLVDSVGNGAIGWVDGGADTIVSGRIVAGAATVFAVPGFDGIP